MVRLAMALLLLAPALILAQGPPEALKGADRTAYEDMKYLKEPVVNPANDDATKANRAILAKQAKYWVGQLTDAKRIQMDTLAAVVEDAILALPVPRGTQIKDTNMDKYLAFGKEMGTALVAELEPATKNSKIVVRVNATRLLSVVGELGCDQAAELALKIIARPDESDAVKHWALRTLGNLFTVEADSVNKEVTVFMHFKNPDLGNKCIVALCEYITTARDVSNLSPSEQAAITFIRREAVKALGNVRTPRLKFGGKVLARPALVLLKVANMDGISPPPDLTERVEAIVGLCQLFPVIRSGADRDVNCDYAAAGLGAAILDIVTIKINEDQNKMIPWMVTADRIDRALLQCAKNVGDLRLNGAPAVKAMHKQAKDDMLDLLKSDKLGNKPNAVGFRQWLQTNPAKSTSLYADEPETKMKAIGN